MNTPILHATSIFLTKLHLLLLITLAIILYSLQAHAFTGPGNQDEPEKYVQTHLVADKVNIHAGDIIRLGVHKSIYPGWHTYWLNPGDSGTAAQVEWSAPEGFKISQIEWPTPQKIPYGPLVNYGHEGEVTLLQNLTAPSDYDGAPFTLSANINLLVCHEICIPETHQASITFNDAGSTASPDIIRTAEKVLPVTKGWPATYIEKNGELHIHVQVEDMSFLETAQNIALLPEEWGLIDNLADVQASPLNTGFQLRQKRGERPLSDVQNAAFVLSYQDQNGQAHAFRLSAQADMAAPAPSQQQDKNADTVSAKTETGISLWQALLFALLGGVILNLMPCVFPVLSMKALSLVNLKGKEEKKAKQSGLAYSAGILFSFALIGGLLIALKSAGTQIGWGFQLQSPVVIILLTYLVFIIGLNLSGFFEFSGRFSHIGQKLTQKSGNTGAFFTGVLATLVATPCTAPFMAGALGFALTQNALISMLVFLFLGLGLALPYLALCYIPILREGLPKPGAWMETFRQFLAFPMFITAAWLIWVLSKQVDPLSVFLTLSALIAIVFTIWLYKKSAGSQQNLFTRALVLATCLFVFAVPFMSSQAPQTDGAQAQTSAQQNWDDFTSQKLESLLEGDKAVFTNMTAAWCITCKLNEKVALSTAGTKALFEERNITYLKGDWTNQNSDITGYLQKFGRSGVPLYVYYAPRDPQSGERPEPVVLPQILTPGIVKKAVSKNL
ncbi:MAG: thioredoxin family protein [Alphaproteobacteria bacterium]|nr:thioredoxin family protein [Alphaproteobacteria bacterium]